MVKIATHCIYFSVRINVAKFAISVWRFSPHCVVKFTVIYSTNYKTVGIIAILSMSYITTRIVKTDKCGKNPQSARRKQNYHTSCGKNFHKILSV